MSLDNQVTLLNVVNTTNAVSEKVSDVLNIGTSNVTKYGAILDEDGWISGFSSSPLNYAYIPQTFNFTKTPFEICIKFKTGNVIAKKQRVFQTDTDHNGWFLVIDANGYYECDVAGSNSTTWNILNHVSYKFNANTTYWIKLNYTGSVYYSSVSTNGRDFTTLYSKTDSTKVLGQCNFKFGISESIMGNNEPFLGKIDLKECYLSINNNKVWSGVNVTKTSILDLLYPVGSIYIGTMATCPLQILGIGNWELVGSDKVLQGAGTRGAVDTTLDEALPNITGKFACATPTNHANYSEGAFAADGFTTRGQIQDSASTPTDQVVYGYNIDASRSSSIYKDNSHVQPDAYLVNIWKRIS